jgi:hypothetical protein
MTWAMEDRVKGKRNRKNLKMWKKNDKLKKDKF